MLRLLVWGLKIKLVREVNIPVKAISQHGTLHYSCDSLSTLLLIGAWLCIDEEWQPLAQHLVKVG